MLSFSDVIKDTPSVSDVHATSGLGNLSIAELAALRRRRKKPAQTAEFGKGSTFGSTPEPEGSTTVTFTVPISKTDESLHTVYGWATVNAEAGQMITDHQGDQISDAEMTKAAHEFVSSSRHGGLLHAQKADGTVHAGGEVVESMVLTQDLQKALGFDLGKTGWFVGYHVSDPDAWELVKSKTLKAFSIGGKARRVPLESP